jgi:hypothetical protein
MYCMFNIKLANTSNIEFFSKRFIWTLLIACLLNVSVQAQTNHHNTVEIVYAEKIPLKIAAVSQYPLKGFDINLIPESSRDSFIYNPVISEETRELNQETAIKEKKALAVGGEYLALVCTNKTSCHLKRNTVLARKERVWVGYSGVGYPDDTEDGLTIQVKQPIKNTVLLLRGNLPSLKKDRSIKTWYANLDDLITKESVAEESVKKKYNQTISLDSGNKLTVIGKAKQGKHIARIDWFVKIDKTEKKLTSMEEPTLKLKEMADVSDYLLWVGDLDGDNQPDLIVNNDGGWGEIEYKLFLSSDIKPNKPWKPAATFDWFSGSPHC